MGVSFFDPGQMHARLDLEQRIDEPDGQGGVALRWQASASLWARIEPVSHVVTERGSAELTTVTHRIWVRFRDGIAAGMRFRKGERIFAIDSVHDPDESRRYLTCHCQEDKR